MQTEMQNEIRAVCGGGGAVTDRTCQSGLRSFLVLLTFLPIILCCGAVLCIGRCLAAPLASTHWKPIAGDSQHTQNIQINKVIGENEKCLLFYRRKPYRLFGQPNIYL